MLEATLRRPVRFGRAHPAVDRIYEVGARDPGVYPDVAATRGPAGARRCYASERRPAAVDPVAALAAE